MSVTAARGFTAVGVAAGIKPTGALDLALVAAEKPVTAAAVFTSSRVVAAPVEVTRRRVSNGLARAVMINSGCANAATGEAGMRATLSTTEALAAAVGCEPDDVLVCSTGTIGNQLPVQTVLDAIPGLVAGLADDAEHGLAAARAIMTTDSVPKQTLVDARGAVVGGMAKGAGMLRPDMATMLAVLTTDLVVEADRLTAALRDAVEVTFNCLNVDGCQSTNDTVIALASGASGLAPSDEDLRRWLEDACRDLAGQMATDAEGASKVVRLLIHGAGSDADARRLGMRAADSALVRSSFYGADPNWGRVLAAMGVAGVAFDPSQVAISYAGEQVCRGGVAVPVDEDALSTRLVGDFDVEVWVGEGPGSAVVVTTDLTPDYVRFNGERS